MLHISYIKLSSGSITQMSTALLTGDSENFQQDAYRKGEQIHVREEREIERGIEWERERERKKERDKESEREDPQVPGWTARNLSTPYSDCFAKAGSFQALSGFSVPISVSMGTMMTEDTKTIYNWSVPFLTPPVTFWYRRSIKKSSWHKTYIALRCKLPRNFTASVIQLEFISMFKDSVIISAGYWSLDIIFNRLWITFTDYEYSNSSKKKKLSHHPDLTHEKTETNSIESSWLNFIQIHSKKKNPKKNTFTSLLHCYEFA